MTLYMVRAELNYETFAKWRADGQMEDTDHAVHCLLKESFGTLAPKPFWVHRSKNKKNGVIYGYGQESHDVLRDAMSMSADPVHTYIMPQGSILSKPMPEEWKIGKQLAFDVRIIPLTRLGNKEMDVYLRNDNATRSRHEVYGEWLRKQIEQQGAATIDRLAMLSHKHVHYSRKPGQVYHNAQGPDVEMRGTLCVADSDAFINLLTRGIGRHRAYGYGMMRLDHPKS